MKYRIVIKTEASGKKKKETLEESAEYYAHNYFEMHDTNNYKALKQGFEAGAKWQQEQDKNKYSEEDMKEMYSYGYNNFLPLEEAFKQLKNK
jgi:hypothetical protein